MHSNTQALPFWRTCLNLTTHRNAIQHYNKLLCRCYLFLVRILHVCIVLLAFVARMRGRLFHLFGKFSLYFQHLFQLAVQIVYDKFAFKIDAIIAFGTLPVLCFLTILTHHNERRLYCRYAGKDKIQQYEWICVKCVGCQNAVHHHPHNHYTDKTEYECPTACKTCNGICRTLPQRRLFLFV